MERYELLRRINTFPLAAATLANDLLSGDFRSVFRGNGIEFEEVRRYEQGDDIRFIDRNVSARFGTPYVKLYREERELTVFVLLDCSASMFSSGKSNVSRFEQALLATALVGFSAERAGQRFGALFFDNEMRRLFKPGKGRHHLMVVISRALEARPRAHGSVLSAAIRAAGTLLKRRSLVVLVSDFRCSGWDDELRAIAGKHDFIAVRITDPFDHDFPNLGLLTVEDPESGKTVQAPGGFSSFRAAWREWNDRQTASWAASCRRLGIARLGLSTEDDAPSVLKSFFQGRRRPLNQN
ncbi:MAG: DUF58 domain-containing protein [Spirochaetaceae bacterium]|jgi:uncharacterized protein (DUF58 family)|nr:DUF58 domain-containing protein [Spirochaetaceae bacterium]